MEHHDSYRDDIRQQKKTSAELLADLNRLMMKVRLSPYYDKHSTFYCKLLEASFWLQNDIP